MILVDGNGGVCKNYDNANTESSSFESISKTTAKRHDLGLGINC